jgi:hypothetical protein
LDEGEIMNYLRELAFKFLISIICDLNEKEKSEFMTQAIERFPFQAKEVFHWVGLLDQGKKDEAMNLLKVISNNELT